MNIKELIQDIVSYIISILGMLILSPLIIFIIIIDMYRGGDEKDIDCTFNDSTGTYIFFNS